MSVISAEEWQPEKNIRGLTDNAVSPLLDFFGCISAFLRRIFLKNKVIITPTLYYTGDKMKFYVSKRCMVRIISFSLAIMIVFAGSIIYNANRTRLLKRQIVHKYQSAMENLSSEMENISITLGKTLYTGTPAILTSLTNELVLQTGTASAALAELPVKHQNLSNVSKFLNQVSDYSLSITRNIVRGEKINEDDRENLVKLSKIAKSLSNSLDEAKTMFSSAENWNESIENALNDLDIENGLDSHLTDTAETLSDYPTLIYDGPFSDHISQKESEMLSSAAEINESFAKKQAAKQLGKKANDFTFQGEENGKLSSFVFGFKNGTVAVTKKGGFVSFFRNEREIKSPSNNYEKAVETAKNYIKNLGIGSFETSYYFADEGMCVVNFAFVQGNTICYPDLIKVGVALDNFEVIFYEASGYIMNHKGRTLKVPVHTVEDAKKVLSPHLTVKRNRLAVIPSGGQNELYCYEFLCVGDQKEDILVYVNTETLAEEQIFILLKTDGGTLTK